MPKPISLLAHGPFYPGTRARLRDSDFTLPRPLFELAIALNADHFTTARYIGPQPSASPYDKRRFATLAGAVVDAGQDERAMVYAVSRSGRSVMIPPSQWADYQRLLAQARNP